MGLAVWGSGLCAYAGFGKLRWVNKSILIYGTVILLRASALNELGALISGQGLAVSKQLFLALSLSPAERNTSQKTLGQYPDIGPLIIRIGCWCILYYKYNKEPQNSIGNYLGPYSTLPKPPQNRCEARGRWKALLLAVACTVAVLFSIAGSPSLGISSMGILNTTTTSRMQITTMCDRMAAGDH